MPNHAHPDLDRKPTMLRGVVERVARRYRAAEARVAHGHPEEGDVELILAVWRLGELRPGQLGCPPGCGCGRHRTRREEPLPAGGVRHTDGRRHHNPNGGQQ